MSKSRTDLIKQIREQRKQAKAQLLYNAGITKLKKSQLREIAQQLKEVNNALRSETEEKEKENLEDDLDDLEDEKEKLLVELEQLKEQDEQTKTEIQELDFDDEEDEEDIRRVDEELNKTHPFEDIHELKEDDYNDDYITFDYDDFEEDTQQPLEKMDVNKIEMEYKKKEQPQSITMTRQDLKKRVEFNDDFDTFEEDEEEEEQKYKHPNNQYKSGLTLQQAKAEINDIMTSFKNMLMDRIKEIKRFKRMNLLTDKFVNESIDYHNYYREQAQQHINAIMDDLRSGEDFENSYISRVNKTFETILSKMEKSLS